MDYYVKGGWRGQSTNSGEYWRDCSSVNEAIEKSRKHHSHDSREWYVVEVRENNANGRKVY